MIEIIAFSLLLVITILVVGVTQDRITELEERCNSYADITKVCEVLREENLKLKQSIGDKMGKWKGEIIQSNTAKLSTLKGRISELENSYKSLAELSSKTRDRVDEIEENDVQEYLVDKFTALENYLKIEGNYQDAMQFIYKKKK